MLFTRTLVSFWKDPEYRDLLATTLIVLAMGTAVYHYLEGWSWLDSAYFSVITFTTVGYGDFSPQRRGKAFTILYIVIGVGIILSFINTVYSHYNAVKAAGKNGASNTDSRA